jgi:hypothetical protein
MHALTYEDMAGDHTARIAMRHRNHERGGGENALITGQAINAAWESDLVAAAQFFGSPTARQ